MKKIIKIFLISGMGLLNILPSQNCFMDFSGVGCNQIFDLTGEQQFSNLEDIEKLNVTDSVYFILPEAFDRLIHYEPEDEFFAFRIFFENRFKFAKLYKKADAIYRYKPPQKLYTFYIFENGQYCRDKVYSWFKVNNQTNQVELADFLSKTITVYHSQERIQLRFENQHLVIFYFSRVFGKFHGNDEPLSTEATCFETKIDTLSRKPVETTLCCFPEQTPLDSGNVTVHPLGVLILEKLTHP